MDLPNHSKIQAYLMASRPKTLFAALGLLFLSFSIAYFILGTLDLAVAVLTSACTLLMQIASNLINDATDAKNGVDTHERLGPMRVTSTGLLTYEEVRWGYRICLFTAFFIGIPLILHGGFIILGIGLISILMAYAYTAGPIPLSHYGLGEILAFVFFGPWAVTGAVYLQTLSFEPIALIAGCLPGLGAAALMAVNNFRDREQDKIANKTTLATLTSFSTARALPLLFAISGVLLVPFALSFYFRDTRFLAASLIIIPFFPIFQELKKSQGGRHLNKILGLMGLFLFSSSCTLGTLFIIVRMIRF
jgi:1,4-dihydroxy-2-naphthoate octaprenyltransferase